MKKMTEKQKKKVNEKFNSIKNGKFTSEDASVVLNNVDSILDMSSSGPLANFFEDIKTMCQMVKAWCKKQYRDIPVGTIGMVILTLVYVFCPIDIITDYIPILGQLDDAAMVGLCLKSMKEDLERFKLWQSTHMC